jgi:hypothetical protein
LLSVEREIEELAKDVLLLLVQWSNHLLDFLRRSSLLRCAFD